MVFKLVPVEPKELMQYKSDMQDYGALWGII